MAATAGDDGLNTGPNPLGATRPPMVPFVGLPFSAVRCSAQAARTCLSAPAQASS